MAIVRNIQHGGSGSSQNLQQTLNNGATATFTHPLGNDTLIIEEVRDSTIGYSSVKTITQYDGNITTSEELALGLKAINNTITNVNIVTGNNSQESGISTTESEYNQIRLTQIFNNDTSEQGSTAYEVPTPKLGVNAILRDPIIETSGTYTRATQEWVTANTPTIIVVANYSALPDVTTVSGKFYWCSASQGTSWLPGSLGGTYYNSGMYYSNGTTWEFLNVPYNATLSEANTGTNNDKFVTPSTLSNSNWAFTSAKVLATLLTGLSASSGTFTATDSILTAFNKLKYLLDNVATNSVPGIMKLFTSTGIATDGTMTQKAITDADALKVDKTSWIDISATSTIVGFSSYTLKTILYKKIDTNLIQVKGQLSGTSNGPLLNFTIPFTSVNNIQNLGIAGIVNNGGTQANFGIATCNANSNVVNIFRDINGISFAGSGTKTGTFSILIEIQ